MKRRVESQLERTRARCALALAGALAACSPGTHATVQNPPNDRDSDAGVDADAGAGGSAPCSGLSGAVRDALGRSPECDQFAPVVTAVDPKAGATGVDPTTTITLRFAPEVDPATITATSVSLSDGGHPVAGTLDVTGDAVVFTPAERLALLATYTVTVTTDVASAQGVPMAQPFTASFTVREGRWEPQPDLSATLFAGYVETAANGHGDLLLATQEMTTVSFTPSEVFARVYHPGSGWTPPVIPSIDAASAVTTPALGPVALSDGGDALVLYYRNTDGTGNTRTLSAARLHAGAWSAPALLSSSDVFPDRAAVSMAPDGSAVVAFDVWPHAGVALAMVPSQLVDLGADGTWSAPPAGDPLPVHSGGLAAARDRTGGAIAVYGAPAGDRVRGLRFSVAGGVWTWLADEEIPGSIVTGAQLGAALRVAADERDRFAALWTTGTSQTDGATQAAVLVAVHDPVTGWSPATVVDSGAPAALWLAERSVDLRAQGDGFVATWLRSVGDRTTFEVSVLVGDGTWATSTPTGDTDFYDQAAGIDARANVLALWSFGSSGSGPFSARYARGGAGWVPVAAPDEAALPSRAVRLSVAGDGSAIGILSEVLRNDPYENLHVDLFR